jgi:hypothetical protein
VETVVNEWLQRKSPVSGATEILKIHAKMGKNVSMYLGIVLNSNTSAE